MATAIATTAGNDDRKAPVTPASGGEKPAAFKVHKPGEGYITRLGMMFVIFAFVIFACWHFYYNWVLVRNFLDEIPVINHLTRWTGDLRVSNVIAYAGTAAIAIVGLLTGYYFVYIKKPTAEYLIKTDTEMHKVTWPKITPWFKADTLVWGSTYVVLIVVVAMTVYVFGVDMVLQWISQKLFYGTSRGSM